MITFAEKKGLSFEDAKVEKQVIEIMKKGKNDLVSWLKDKGEEYVTPKGDNKDIVRRILNGR